MDDATRVVYEAMQKIATPNRAVKPTAEDAAAIVRFAAATLETHAQADGVSRDPRVFVSDDRQTLVRFWQSGEVEVARRESPGATWGPPMTLIEEK